jgi:hypothetical protein
MIKHFCTQTKSFEPLDIIKTGWLHVGEKTSVEENFRVKIWSSSGYSLVQLQTPW